MSISRGWFGVAASLAFVSACAASPAPPGQSAMARPSRAVAAVDHDPADKATRAVTADDKSTIVQASSRVRRGAPGCDGDAFALVGTARARADPYWIDCRTGDRVQYADAEFEAWFAARHAARASAPGPR